ncbi:GNAT family N-acetyltransferase [Alicyclobacillus macrosporangiidus]|uniref:Ribosomal protein S18 acetylase RimI n=1 Tax=Alicyclobacillus macrosporangiidus TaxID=392015 RepID=A0A1I7G9Y3_9BACL|nr:GNAT family N-acetyltransferase [Alicyclobacillus macrosporangiidus]SFU45265.1 Ribosomal protein S18 acetylase RimI [Alicyclobacillus macrosporangiidus]
MTLTFRLATPSEAELIHAITQDAWEEYRHVAGSSSAFDETPEQIEKALTNGTFMAVLGLLDGETPVLSVRFTLTDHLYFSRLGVRSAHQGRGYARMALAWMEDFAQKRGVREIHCTVRASVPRNVYLYESMGYRKIDEQTVVKSPDVQLIVWTMAKSI